MPQPLYNPPADGNWYQWIIDHVPSEKRDAFIYAMTNYVPPGVAPRGRPVPGNIKTAIANLALLEQHNPQRFAQYKAADFTYLPFATEGNPNSSLNNWDAVTAMATGTAQPAQSTQQSSTNPTPGATISAPGPNQTYTPLTVYLTPEMLPDDQIDIIFDNARKYTPVAGLYDNISSKTFDSSNPHHREMLWAAIQTYDSGNHAGYDAMVKQYYNPSLTAPDKNTYINPDFGAAAAMSGGVSHSSNYQRDITSVQQQQAAGNPGFSGTPGSSAAPGGDPAQNQIIYRKVMQATGLDPASIGQPDIKLNDDGTTSIIFKNHQQLAWYTGVITEQAKAEQEQMMQNPVLAPAAITPDQLYQQRAATAQNRQTQATLQDLMSRPGTPYTLEDLTMTFNR
jgi:hypothetical protein